jgi:hypothetical protein
MNLLEEEASAKMQKLIDCEIKKKEKKNLVGFLALNVVSGADSIVCRRAFKVTKYKTYIFAEAAPKIVNISLLTL